ncbi:MAG TPA: carboxypeptidase-like regulatory domain-containing protein [Terriglobales bacterium]|nr:carboxypeptidase-like regulatory domain-containing protein [Terriglobales bacterium]
MHRHQQVEFGFLLALLLAAIAFLPPAVQAQTGTTAISGQVVDQHGAVIAGAAITLVNVNTAATRTANSDAAGNYTFSSLPPSTYRLRVEAPGFRTELHDNLALLVNVPLRHNVTLQVGAAQEIMEVSAAAERLNTIDASVGNAFAENQIKQLPLEARNVVGLLSLQAGSVFLPVQPNSADNDPRSGAISGGHSDQANVTMDGVDVNDSQTGFAYTSVLRATLDSVQEFRVTTTNYGADQGRSSGAQVSLITKSGSNTPHGSAYWYHRNTAFSSNEFFNKLAQYKESQLYGTPLRNRPPLLQKHIFGASFSFAPLKDRLFFFSNFEDQRLSAAQSVERYVPSTTMRDGILVYPCADSTQCPGGTVNGFTGSHAIPAGWYGLSPAQLGALDPLAIGPSVAASQYFQQFPSSNSTGRDGTFVPGFGVMGNITGYRFNAPVKNNWWTYITRLDFNVDHSGKHQLMWRGNLQNDRDNAQPTYCWSGGKCTSPMNITAGNNRGMMIGYTAALTPQLVNNFRYGYTRIGSNQGGLFNSPYVDFRFIDDISGFDYATTTARGRISPTHNFTDDISWNRGNHTFQLGANLRLLRVETHTNGNSYPDVVTNGSWVAGNGKTYIPGRYSCPFAACDTVPAVSEDAYASYADSWIDILGVLSESDAVYNYDRQGHLIPFGVPIKRRWASNAYEFYAQDNYRIKSNLNIVAGLRWSYSSPPWETNGLQVAPTTPLGDWFNQRGKLMYAGQPANAIPLIQFNLAGPANNSSLGFYKKDWNNFSPRLAFTYSPGWNDGWLAKLTGGPGKTVVRGGYGWVYDQLGLALANQFDQVGAFGLASSVSSPWHGHSEDDPTVRFTNLTTIPNTLPAPLAGGFPYTPPTAQGSIQQSMDSNIRTPFSQMFNFFIGRELPAKMTLDLGYVGRRASKVLTRRDLAMPLDLVDPASSTDYFKAAKQIIDALAANGQDWSKLPAIPYWEHIFPDAANGFNSYYTLPDNGGYAPVANNTQAVGYNFSGMEGDWTTALYSLDEYCDPACSKFGPFAYFDPQFDALGALSSVGFAKYDALQVSLRKQYSNGIQFDANYTFSKSMDSSSAVERGSNWTTFGDYYYSNFLINSWDPRASYGNSDFDVRHQFNFNYVVDLPFGKGRRFAGAASGLLDAFVGGWQTTGILRLNSGMPFDIINCRSCWPTNWQLQGNTQFTDLNAVRGLLGTTLNKVGGNPSPFTDPEKVLSYLRYSYPGEGGQRNRLTGDGYYTWDVGMGKSFNMPYAEGHKLKFRWDIFNLTNSARFNVANAILVRDFASTFGSYTSTYSGCDNAAGRCMQLSLRYEF